MNKVKVLLAFAAVLAVAGCSEGTVDIAPETSTPNTAVQYDISENVQPVPTSYQTANDFNTVLVPRKFQFTRAQIDVDGDGRNEIFVAEQSYQLSQTPQTATKGNFAFYRRGNDNSFYRDKRILDGTQLGCIHPRKAIVNDFNLDGRMDVFVACHGWDQRPWPGERNKIVLSQEDGTYVIQDASSQMGFFHGAASADFNGDGAPDVIVVGSYTGSRIQVWLNDGKGDFKATSRYVPRALKNGNSDHYYTVELPDVNGDGNFDLFVGGADWGKNANTYVFLNPGNNNFSNRAKILIPAVYGEGMVLDVVVTEGREQRLLWVLRTSGGDGTAYEGATVQKYGLTDNTSEIAYHDGETKWFPWIFPFLIDGQTYIMSDDISRRRTLISE